MAIRNSIEKIDCVKLLRQYSKNHPKCLALYLPLFPLKYQFQNNFLQYYYLKQKNLVSMNLLSFD